MSFKLLNSEDFVFTATPIAASVWSNYTSSLTSFYTSSLQIGSPSYQYYLNVYNTSSKITTSEVQFNIAFGDINGSASLFYNAGVDGASPTRTIYGQFVNLLLGEDENNYFTFETPTQATCFYIITLPRARYKQALLPGSLQIKGLTDSDIYITDNSRITSSLAFTTAGRRYTLGSGSFGDGIMPAGSTDGVYGYLYPDVGIILLNPKSFKSEIRDKVFFDGSDDRPSNSNVREFNKILMPYITQFTLQSEETITSNYIFCRARNDEFNFSTQPNFISSTRNITGSYDVISNDFIKTPSTYITSVGLYNDNHDLLAIAKLSKPLKKDFTTEALIRVKLDF